jgi:Flp pilus assembly protein TadD
LNDEQGRLLLERALRSGSAGDLATALADLRGLVARDPRDAEDRLRLGVAEAQAGDQAAAEQAWVVAERLAPHSASAATDLATLYAGQGRWSEAAAAARRALARDPADAQAAQVVRDSAGHVGT